MERKLAVLAVLLNVMFMAASAHRTTVTTVVEEVLAVLLNVMFMAASAHRTTVTTVVEEEGIRESCREQIRKQQQVLRGGGKIIMLAEDETNVGQLQDCCWQLRQVEERSRCKEIEEILQVQQQQGKQGRRLREAIQTGENLPNMCRMSPQSCDISVRGGYDGHE
ncbi:hypothetical protein SAY87_010435 [Trapa incisa]|uniref:Bifunctional inhibitor/plant lipid transfer protein/seed storage helical domain-containing protein n=1 Tax=Trapa incisa TaxID=236973 RepID=A0AAN7GPH7_9MYRT|nr:hypothetical protein SAY87_010435 [Trapa incisa]